MAASRHVVRCSGTELDWLASRSEWAGLNALAMVESTRQIGSKRSAERRDYLCSITDVHRIAQSIGDHRRIENEQHWVQDVPFGEDASRTRKGPQRPQSGTDSARRTELVASGSRPRHSAYEYQASSLPRSNARSLS